MNFFLLYVSLPALLFGIMSKTPFAELNNPPFLIATTLGTASAFVLAMIVGRLLGRLSFREATLAGLAGAYGNIGYMGPGLALAVLGTKAAAPTALIFCCDSIFLFSIVPLLVELSDRDHPSPLHALRSRGPADRAQSADHVGLRRRARGSAPSRVSGRDHEHAGIPAKRRGAGGAVRARRHRGAAAVQPDSVGSARHHRGETVDPSA